MKAYLIGYKVGSPQVIPLEAQYSLEPALRYATRGLAATDCMHLNRQRLTIGAHSCAFAVDELPEGGFGIICICHPVILIGETLAEASKQRATRRSPQ